MPMRTGYIYTVIKNARFGDRFDVYLRTPGFAGNLPLYTTNALQASLCERAGKVQRAVTIRTRDGRFGEQIVDLELVPHEQEGAA